MYEGGHASIRWKTRVPLLRTGPIRQPLRLFVSGLGLAFLLPIACGSFHRTMQQLQRCRARDMVSTTRCVPAARRTPGRAPCRVMATAQSQVGYRHVLLTILDANAYLSEGSKQAVAAAASMATASAGKVTVLVVDEEGTRASKPGVRIENISWHFKNSCDGFENYTILEKDIQTPAALLIGDVADDLQADLVLLSTEAVHAKHVDANQLAEFVSCPLLLLP